MFTSSQMRSEVYFTTPKASDPALQRSEKSKEYWICPEPLIGLAQDEDPVAEHDRNHGIAVKCFCVYKAASVAFLMTGQERVSKQSMREEAERLIRETMARKAIVVKQGNTRIEAVCGKCGAPNRVSAEKGASRVKFACKQCGHKQETL